MKNRDSLIIKHKDKIVDVLICMESTHKQYLFCKPKHIVGTYDNSTLWVEDIGSSRFLPINKKHNFVEVYDGIWELDIEPIDKNDL